MGEGGLWDGGRERERREALVICSQDNLWA